MCGPENDVFPRKFENCAVLTAIKPEQPGQSLRKPQDKSQCRQGGFLTVYALIRKTYLSLYTSRTWWDLPSYISRTW